MKRKGFTIVELLIVIVVIAILAAITIVAYNGIVVRANTSAVSSDLTAIAKKLELYKIDNGVYPAGVDNNALKTALQTVDVKLTLDAYFSDTSSNLLYITEQDGSKYSLIALPVAGVPYTITNDSRNPKPYGGSGQSQFPGGSAINIATYLGYSGTSLKYYIFVPGFTFGYRGFKIWY